MREDKYEKTLKYLFGLEKFGMIFGLDNIRWLLNIIQNPHSLLRTVHIAGTNGKGSTATMLADILQEGGFRVGKYTSPHVVSFTERITVNEERISEEEIVDIAEYLRSKVAEEDQGCKFTFFDFTTAMAFEYFRRKNVEVAVIETGLGGRLDSTNVITPLLSIITNVAFDHTDQLGETLEKIALEKAGIIKDGVPVITGCEGISRQIIEEKAGELHAPLYVLGRDFNYEKTGDQRLAYQGMERNLEDVFVNLPGDHQLTNCALALSAAEALSSLGYPVQDGAILRALSRLVWQGRLEKLRESPLLLLDAAHNLHGIHALSEYIRTHYRDKKKILVFGVMKDKEYEKMVQEIASGADTVILTKPQIERALLPQNMKAYVNNAIITENVRNALEKAKAVATEKDLILVTGSFYTIGEAKAIINEIF